MFVKLKGIMPPKCSLVLDLQPGAHRSLLVHTERGHVVLPPLLELFGHG